MIFLSAVMIFSFSTRHNWHFLVLVMYARSFPQISNSILQVFVFLLQIPDMIPWFCTLLILLMSEGGQVTREPLFEGMFCQSNVYVPFLLACYYCFIHNELTKVGSDQRSSTKSLAANSFA